MNAARDTGTCQRLDNWLSAYVDGELDVVHCLEVEDHLERCDICEERVAMLHATKVSLREVAEEKAPQALRERVCRALLDGREPSDGDPAAEEPAAPKHAAAGLPPQLAKLRYVVPLAAAATLALVLGAMQLHRDPDTTVASTPSSMASAATASIDTLVDELVNQHASPPRLDVTDPNELRELEPNLRVRLRPTNFDDNVGARYIGARQNPTSVLMRYALRNKNNITMYVFNTENVAVRSQRLEPRRIGARRVFVGRVRGYPVAAAEHEGRGVLLAADDLDDDKAAELVLTASR